MSMRSLFAMLVLCLCAAGWGCGTAQPGDRPPDPNEMRPPPIPPGGQYGSGSGSGGMPVEPPVCPTDRRRCPTPFAYSGSVAMPLTGNETLVEIKGSFDNWGAGVKMAFDGAAKTWKGSVDLPMGMPVKYKFRVVFKDGSDKWIPDPTNPDQVDDGFGGKNSQLMNITCKDYTCAPVPTICRASAPKGYDWRDAVIYFAFVDRFYDGDPTNNKTTAGVDPIANWRGGDWAGLTQKIKDGYFNDLGVNTLWISVPADNTDGFGVGNDDGLKYSAYHGYWPRDLDKPDSHFGTMAELQTLVDTAHSKGLKVLADYAMNHVHTDSQLWKDHMSDGWFNPLDLGGGKQCICGSAACPWEGAGKEKVCWFSSYMADFNFNNVAARNFSVNNAIGWFKDKLMTTRLDGFRLDAIKHIELSWLTDLRNQLNTIETASGQHPYLVGETYTGNRDLIKQFIEPGKMLDGQFDFPLRATVNSVILTRQGKMQDLSMFMDGNTCYYGDSIMSTFVGNHDVPRVIHFGEESPLWGDVWAGGKERGWMNQPGQPTDVRPYERVALAMTVLMTNRGAPLIYYGDEIGLSGGGDPDNRRMMTFDATKYNDGQKLLLSKMKKLGAIRAAHPSLRRGDRTTLDVKDDVWVYSVVDDKDTVYVAINRSSSTQPAPGLPDAMLKDELNGGTVSGKTATVPARSALILTP